MSTILKCHRDHGQRRARVWVGALRCLRNTAFPLCLLMFSQRGLAQDVDLFRTTPTYGVGNGPAAIVTCDLNEDGLPDVVTANQAFNDVAVLLADGKGSFLPQVRFGVGRFPEDLVCADFDNDGHLDVATVDKTDNRVSILRGNGDGTFAVGALTIVVQG